MEQIGLQLHLHYRCDCRQRSPSVPRLWRFSALRSWKQTWWQLNPHRSALVDTHAHTQARTHTHRHAHTHIHTYIQITKAWDVPSRFEIQTYLRQQNRLWEVLLLPEYNKMSWDSPGIPPDCKSERCGTKGKRPFPNPPHFCTCDYAHAPKKQKQNVPFYNEAVRMKV